MPIPSTGPLSLSAIQTEFGGTNPISLSEYYAGGSFTPAGTTGTNGAVPTSGTIAMSRFYGTTAIPPTRALFGGGATAGGTSGITSISTVMVATTSNSSSYGNLSEGRAGHAACSSTTRAVFAGGEVSSNWTSGIRTSIEFKEIASAGNASLFGTLANTAVGDASAGGNQTRGIISGSTPQFITIATAGNSTTFGNWTSQRGLGHPAMAAASSSSRVAFYGGVYSEGKNVFLNNVIDFFTISSLSAATFFGTISSGVTSQAAGCSSSTRGVFAGGVAVSSSFLINFITLASTSNTSTFGDLTYNVLAHSGTSSPTRGVFAGGIESSNHIARISFITIATLGNAVNFGNLSQTTAHLSACSNGHGGLS